MNVQTAATRVINVAAKHIKHATQISWSDIKLLKTLRKYTKHHIRTYHHNSRVAA